MNNARRTIVAILVVLLQFMGVSLVFGGGQKEHVETRKNASSTEPTIPVTTISFANAPYIDGSTSIIGTTKGWFKEVGIDIRDPHLFTPIENAGSFIASGSADVVDAGLVQIMPSLNSIPDLRIFVLHDLFQGQAIMGQPNFKTVSDYVKEGMTLKEAERKAVGQMKGKTLLLAPDPASSSFAATFLQEGGLSLSDVHVITADYKEHVPLMLARRADFENGGGPTIVQMLKNGFQSIITTSEVLQGIKIGSPDMSKLTSVVLNGYVASESFVEKHYPAILRLASVNYRICDFIAHHPKEAAAIQAPFLNRYGGSQLDAQDVVFLDTQVDPFFGFEAQHTWYTDKNSIHYWKYWTQEEITANEKSGALSKGGNWTPDNIELSHKVWADLNQYREEASQLISDNASAIIAKGGRAQLFLIAAEKNMGIFNYYDAHRFAQEAVKLLEK